MEFNELGWATQQPRSAGVALTGSDIEAIAKLMCELREVTLSRGTYVAASDFLRRFGYDADSSALVRPESCSN
ncbi:MAG: hypothetical protein SFW09_00800 [Hyphomicrobiaceae bacterium]|nr:hypothetical protein [Hyphomicrobiaceae bacterium]